LPLGVASFIFGDFKSYKTSDQYAVFIMGRSTENTGANTSQYDPMAAILGSSVMTLNSKMFGHYVARSWSGVGGSVNCLKTTDYGKLGTLIGLWASDSQQFHANNGNFTFGRNTATANLMTPNGPDGALIVAPVYIGHSFALRGYLPGLWCPLQDRPFNHNDTITVASGNLNGKSLLCQQIQAFLNNNASTEIGQCLVEYSDTWT
jgi:hypothetical protein